MFDELNAPWWWAWRPLWWPFMRLWYLFFPPKLEPEVYRRMAILRNHRLVRAAMDSDSLDDDSIASLTAFVHGQTNTVRIFGHTFRHVGSVPAPPRDPV